MELRQLRYILVSEAEREERLGVRLPQAHHALRLGVDSDLPAAVLQSHRIARGRVTGRGCRRLPLRCWIRIVERWIAWDSFWEEQESATSCRRILVRTHGAYRSVLAYSSGTGL
jgi:hypothetical protein